MKHPTQQGFSIAAWGKAFANCGDKSKPGINLYEAGIWAYSKFESIRSSLRSLDLSHTKESIFRKMVIGHLNRTVKVLFNYIDDISNDRKLLLSQELIQLKIDASKLSAPLDPDSIMEFTTDGARYPLSINATTKVNNYKAVKLDDIEILRRLKGIVLLGQLYDAVENLWNEILWNSWHFLKMEKNDLIHPSEDAISVNRTVSEYRRQSLLLQDVQNAVYAWRSKFTEYDKKTLAHAPIIRIEGSGKNKRYFLEETLYSADNPPMSLIGRLLAVESYYEGLMDEELPSLPGITLFDLLNAWEILEAIANAHIDRFPKSSEVFKINKLMQYAPKIKKSDIVHLIARGHDISHRKATTIFSFLTFVPNPRSELWSSPIVNLENDWHTIAIGPVLHGNRLRILESLMRRGGVDLSKRGTLFEKDCRDRLSRALSANPILDSAEIHPNSFTLKTSGEKEEIDLIIRIEKTILIVEAKCLLFPAEPLEYFNYFDTLNQACTQIKRKAGFVEKHIELFLESLKWTNDIQVQDIKLVPIVLVNQPIGAGLVINAIPIIDIRVISLYLRQSKLEHFVLFDEKGKKQFIGKETNLYESKEQASENILSYLCNPPQIEMLKRFIKIMKYPSPMIDGLDKPWIFLNPEVQLPIPEETVRDG
ncbi:MAG: hypothetical protein KAU50_11270 [Candidatus Marinimicrobia bacterium]|nr:hypothetical protein [Candidatus Neomarinimicrobiota bacterium]